jgi:hypothetical protein
VISLLISLIILALIMFIIVLPVGIAASSGSGSETVIILTIFLSVICFLLLSMIFTLAADYARAWHVIQDKQSCFKALGFGFSRTFGTFLSSYPMMLILLIIQLVFTTIVMLFLSRWKPDTRGGVFLLFLASQMLFYIKCGLKVWRYGSVTSLMEIKNSEKQEPIT